MRVSVLAADFITQYTECIAVLNLATFFLFISEERTTTHVSPNGIPRGIYSIMYSLE